MADAAPGMVAVTLSIAPALEERLIDWLLARGDVAAFASVVVNAYGADSRKLSVAEQVSGRQRRVELTVELPASALEGWLDELAAALVGIELRYRVTPILQSGRLPPGAV